MNNSRVLNSVALVLLAIGLATPLALADEKEHPRGWLGVQVAPIDEESAAAAGIAQEGALMLGGVIPDGPAEKAGFKRGDVLLTVRGKPITSFDVLREILSGTRVGQRVTCIVARDGEEVELLVELGPRPQEATRQVDVHRLSERDRRLAKLEAQRAEVAEARQRTEARIAELREAIVAAAEGKEDQVREWLAGLLEATQQAARLGHRQEQIAGAVREARSGSEPDAAAARELGQKRVERARRAQGTRIERPPVEARIDALEGQIRELAEAMRRLMGDIEEMSQDKR